jgi:predicted NAD/FAD-binding protein
MKEKIAIIGSGISGLTSAYFLQEKYDVFLYEKNDYFGGHSNTVEIDYDDKKIAVDTGFIVFNHQTYPNLKAFFKLLDVAYEESNMSFAAKIDDGKIEYCGTSLGGVFAQQKNIFNPQFLLMICNILRFNKKAEEILQKPFNASYSLKNLLDDLRLKKYFRQYYLLPMSGAIWSCPLATMLEYPAQSFVRFFKNHGLLTTNNQPQWYTVSGGSKNYVQKIIKSLGDKAIINDEVIGVWRNNAGGVLVKSKNSEKIFDKVVFANHADDALRLMQNASASEVEILSNFKYQKNLAILHRDSSVMPKSKKAWASWVYSNNSKKDNGQISLSYWMNNLQNIDKNYPLFVTLNPNSKIDLHKIFASFNYDHPIFDAAAVAAQERIGEIQGIDRFYFCGAYQKYGFHEDGISSAIKMMEKLGVKTPWHS